MKKRLKLVAALAAAVWGAGCAASTAAQPAPPRADSDRIGHVFVYAAQVYQLYQYEMGADGILAPLNPPSVPTTSTAPNAMADPTGQFVFSLDGVHGDVFRYETHPDGSLVTPSTLASHIDGNPLSLSFDPSGHHIYVVDYSVDAVKGVSRIYQFRMGAGGKMVPLSPPYALTEGTHPRQVVFTTDGRFAYACEASGITQYAVSPDGALRAQTPPEVGPRSDFEKLVMDPRGRFLYATGDIPSPDLARFRIEADGRLTALPPIAVFAGGQTASSMRPSPDIALEPTGHFAYIATSDFNSQAPSGPPDGIFQYRVSNDGSLTPLSPARVPTVSYGRAISFDPQGRFLYTGNNEVIAQFQIRPDGTLAPLTPRVLKGAGIWSISVVQRADPAHFAPTRTAASDVPRQQQPPSASTPFDTEEVITFDDPSREARFHAAERALVFAPKGRFAYLSPGPNNTVSRFAVGADDNLTPLSSATAPGSPSLEMLALDPAGNFAYLSNPTGKIAQFRILTDGAFAPLTPPALDLDATRIVVRPGGRFLYTQGTSGEVSLLKIAVDGTLSPVAPASGFLTRSGAASVPEAYSILPQNRLSNSLSTWGLTLSPSGKAAYLLTRTGEIRQYAVGSDGKLTPLSPAAVDGGADPQPVSFSPDGLCAYVVDSLVGQIRQYSVSASGALTPLSPPTLPAGSMPLSLTVSPSGRFAYAVEGGQKSVLYRDYANGKLRYRLLGQPKPVIEQFTIGADGALYARANTSLSTPMTGAIVFGPTGRFAYQTDGYDQHKYRIGADGLLSLVTLEK